MFRVHSFIIWHRLLFPSGCCQGSLKRFFVGLMHRLSDPDDCLGGYCCDLVILLFLQTLPRCFSSW